MSTASSHERFSYCRRKKVPPPPHRPYDLISFTPLHQNHLQDHQNHPQDHQHHPKGGPGDPGGGSGGPGPGAFGMISPPVRALFLPRILAMDVWPASQPEASRRFSPDLGPPRGPWGLLGPPRRPWGLPPESPEIRNGFLGPRHPLNHLD